jgi:hypothetical protein
MARRTITDYHKQVHAYLLNNLDLFDDDNNVSLMALWNIRDIRDIGYKRYSGFLRSMKFINHPFTLKGYYGMPQPPDGHLAIHPGYTVDVELAKMWKSADVYQELAPLAPAPPAIVAIPPVLAPARPQVLLLAVPARAEARDCPVCYTPVRFSVVLECSHIVCTDCFPRLSSPPCCPLCRASIA